MLKERKKVVYTILTVIDIFTITAAFLVAYYLRGNFSTFYHLDIFPQTEVFGKFAEEPIFYGTTVYFLGVTTWIFVLWAVGFYSSFRTRPLLMELWLIIKAASLNLIVFGSLAFIIKVEFISRFFIILFCLTSACFLFFNRVAIITLSRLVRRSGYNYREILVVGTGHRTKKFIALLYKHAEWGIKIIGLIDKDPARVGKKFLGIKCIGTMDDIGKILNQHVVDEVVAVVPRSWLNQLQNLISVCELQGVQVNVAADLFNVNIARSAQRDLDGFPLLSFESPISREWELTIKRFFDIIVSFLGLIVISPLFLLVSILIKLTSPGPVFFRQPRVGLNGRVFNLHKFRSMYKNASQQLEKIKHFNEMDGPVFKIKNDPRITPLGRFLRRSSIDELPQLFDVLIGNISLVGPRPPLPKEVEQYEPWQKRRLSMRPGITCLWQVMGRSKLSFQRWMELDLEYIDNWSLWLDFKILMRTIPVVISGEGAH